MLSETGAAMTCIIPTAVSTVVLGVIHLAAWNSDFASLTKKLLWRIRGSLAVGIPLVLPFALSVPERERGIAPRSSIALSWIVYHPPHLSDGRALCWSPQFSVGRYDTVQ